jgi:hypothetical protein
LFKTALATGAKFKPALVSDFYEQLYADRQPSAGTRASFAATPYEVEEPGWHRQVPDADGAQGPP